VVETPRARDVPPRQRSPRPGEGPLLGPQPRPRHLAAGLDQKAVPLSTSKRTPATRRHGWHWLLVAPVVMPLLIPLYNRMTPALWGIPFFYWYQMACAVFSMITITFVFQITKGRR
jgi:Protein of unknown function (DUF3311)